MALGNGRSGFDSGTGLGASVRLGGGDFSDKELGR
jgi:hypothetical protein